MKMLIALFAAAAAVLSAQVLGNSDVVRLDVYYESQCPDSYNFFLKLRPAAIKLNQHLNVFLYPYGNAKTIRDGDKVTFKCQHGPTECLLNKIHACGLKRLNSDLKRVLFASCLFDDYKNPLNAGENCSPAFGLEWRTIIKCANGPQGTILEDHYGNATIPHSYVPYMAVDKYTGDDAYQAKIESDPLSVLCETLAKKQVKPPVCEST